MRKKMKPQGGGTEDLLSTEKGVIGTARLLGEKPNIVAVRCRMKRDMAATVDVNRKCGQIEIRGIVIIQRTFTD